MIIAGSRLTNTTMKKSTTAKTSKAVKTPVPAKKAVKPAPAAIPTPTKKSVVTKPLAKAKPAPTKVEPKPVAPVTKPVKKTRVVPAPPVSEPTPAVAAAEPRVVSTTITAAVDVGFGNFLTLRGEGAGLSWESGQPLVCVNQDRWSISLPESSGPIVCKFLLNDQVWNTGENFTVLPGFDVVLDPVF